MKKRIGCIVFVAMFIQFSVVGQSQLGKREVKSGEKTVDKMVSLLNFNNDSSLILLYECDNYKILTYRSIFKNEMAELVKLKGFRELYNQILAEAEEKKFSNAYQLACRDNFTSWAFMYQVSNLLERGQCLVFCKSENEYGAVIRVQTYETYIKAGIMYMGNHGRKFFLNDIQIWDQWWVLK
jgi:hypothetical protein